MRLRYAKRKASLLNVIVLIGSQKGGCGKSTIATNLAANLACNGRDVILLDTDVQSTASTWAADREQLIAAKVSCVQRSGNVTETAKELSRKYDYVVIDAGGRDSQELRTSLLVADLSIHPFRPSQADLDTIFQLSEVINQAKDFNPTLTAVALLTMCPTHPGNTEINDAREYLSDHLKVLDCVVHDRKAYRDALSEGLSVVEHTDPKAKQEIINLTQAVTDDS